MKFRNREEKLGVLLGSICFLPSWIFVVIIALNPRYIIVSIAILIVTQSLWLNSIYLCTKSLEKENRELKKKLEELK